MLKAILSTTEAAALLDLTEERVLQFVRAGRIEGRKLKREWVLSRASVLAFRRKPRKDGRPKVDPRQVNHEHATQRRQVHPASQRPADTQAAAGEGQEALARRTSHLASQ